MPPGSPESPRLITLGRLALEDASGAPLVSAESSKFLALLAYVAAAPGRRVSRDRLIDLFWADRPIEKARGSLRQLLFRAREVLGADAFRSEATGELVLVAPLETDREDFALALERNRIEDALALYRGPFVPGMLSAGSPEFEHWADMERERLKEMFFECADAAARRLLGEGRHREALHLAGRLLLEQPTNERAWRLRIEAEVSLHPGPRVRASIAELLRTLDGHGTTPESRTLDLIRRLGSTVPGETASQDAVLRGELVGRSAQFSALHDAWLEAAGGAGRHVHIVGPAGLGKSRLLDDFAIRLAAERVAIVRVRATPRQRDLPWSAAADLALGLAKLPGAPGLGKPSAGILIDLAPSLGDRYPGVFPQQQLDPSERRLARFGALEGLLQTVLEEGPVVLLLDDLHWWDGASREVVLHLSERFPKRPLLILTAARPALPIAADLEISLPPLGQPAILELLRSLAGTTPPSDLEELSETLRSNAGGSPLLIVEALQLGISQGTLVVRDEGLDFGRAREFLTTLEPTTLLTDRLARLCTEERATLGLAAVLEVALPENCPMAKSRSSAVHVLEQRGLLRRVEGGWAVGHDLQAEALLSSMSEKELREAHAEAARLLSHRPGDPIPIARHLVEAGDTEGLSEAAGEWLERRRLDGDVRPAASLIRELMGPAASEELAAEVLRRLPARSKLRPGVLRLAAGAALGAAMIGGVWAASAGGVREQVVLGLEILGIDSLGSTTFGRARIVGDSSASGVRLHAEWSEGPILHMGAREWPGLSITTLDIGPEGAIAWVVKDSSGGEPTELVIERGGKLTRFPPVPGDDAWPRWSPDEETLVFATTRYAEGEGTFDLALMDVQSGGVHPLIVSVNSEEGPAWSPEGARIAFVRRPAMLMDEEICWIGLANGTPKCWPAPGWHLERVVDWLDMQRVLVIGDRVGGRSASIVDLETGAVSPFDLGLEFQALWLSPDRQWVFCQCVSRELGIQRQEVQLLSLRDRVSSLRLELPSGLGSVRAVHWTGIGSRPGDSVGVTVPLSVVGVVGIPVRPPVVRPVGPDRTWRVPPSLVSWEVDDTMLGIGRDSLLVPKTPGVTQVLARVGGWRSESVLFRVIPREAKVVMSEDWTDSWDKQWMPWGDPLPERRDDAQLGSTLLLNGDREYDTALDSRARLATERGLSVDWTQLVEVTRPAWQRIVVRLSRARYSDGSTAGSSVLACTFAYPTGEGILATRSMTVGTLNLPVDPAINSGRPTRMRLQLFPDGSCGLAIDGRPIVRSDPQLMPDRVHVQIHGQTVDDAILIGPVTVWEGVPEGVDWAEAPIR